MKFIEISYVGQNVNSIIQYQKQNPEMMQKFDRIPQKTQKSL